MKHGLAFLSVSISIITFEVKSMIVEGMIVNI